MEVFKDLMRQYIRHTEGKEVTDEELNEIHEIRPDLAGMTYDDAVMMCRASAYVYGFTYAEPVHLKT